MQTFTIVVNNECAGDTLALLTSTFPVSPYIYYIGENTEYPALMYSAMGRPQEKLFQAKWDATIAGCPTDFKVEREDPVTGQYRDLQPDERVVTSL